VRVSVWSSHVSPSEHDAHRRGRVTDETARPIIVEACEEARVALVHTCVSLLHRTRVTGSTALLRTHTHRLVFAGYAFVHDPAPPIVMLGCRYLCALASTTPAGFRPFAIGLAKSLGPVLNHRHWDVRLEALGALDVCVSIEDPLKRKGAGTEAIQFLVGHRDDNVIPVRAFYKGETMRNRFAPLILDPNPRVREAFVRVVGGWLWSLPDRMDHESRLVPYLLSALTDDAERIRQCKCCEGCL
jgi:hypothetical protein